MIDSKNNPNTSTSPAIWTCQGTPRNSHPEIENWGDSCMFPGCNNTKENLSKSTVPSPLSKVKKLIPILGIALASISLLGGAYVVYDIWQKFQTCPEGQEKQNGTCVFLEVSTNQNSASGNLTTPKNRSTSINTNPTTSVPSITFNPEWISQGDRILFKGSTNKYRDDGIAAFNRGNYAEAIKYFEKAVFSNRNDPEVQIYLNNAQAAFQGSPLKIAAVVPIDNRETSAKEILRGIADAQTRFNNTGGAGGKLVQVVIGNDGNEPTRAQSIAHQLATTPDILGVIGHNSSGASQAALTEYEQADLVMISPTSTSTSLKSNYFYRTVPSDAAGGKKLAEYANQQGINKVAIFYNPDSSYSQSLQESFEANFQKLGGIVLGSIDISDSNFDPRQQIQSLQNQVDAIALFPNTDTTSIAISLARANQELSTPKLPMLGGDALYSYQTLNDGGSVVDGLTLTVPWFAASQPYAQAASQRWIGTVNWRTAASYDATQALLKALALSSNPNRASVGQNLQSLSLSASETSGNQLSFSDGEREGEAILVQIVPGAIGKPRDFRNGFKLIEP